MCESKKGSELLKEQTPTFARWGAKANMAETRKLSMDVADERGAAAAPIGAARVLAAHEACAASARRPSQELLASMRKDGDAIRRGARWSPRATLALSGGVALVLWGLIGLAVSAIR
jgi:Flp pilus assembly protein TadB